MFKKVITTVFSLCLIFGICAMTVSAADETQQNGMPWSGVMQSGELAIPEGFTAPEGFNPSDGEITFPQNSGEFTPPQNEESESSQATDSQTDTRVTSENQQASENSDWSGQTQGRNQQFDGRIQGGNPPFGGGMGGFSGNMTNSQNTVSNQSAGFLGFVKTYSTPVTSIILLGLAFIFVVFYRRKNY